MYLVLYLAQGVIDTIPKVNFNRVIVPMAIAEV